MLHHEPMGGRVVHRTELRGFLDSVYAQAAGNRRCIVDKSPGELVHRGRLVTDTIFELFPEARVLYLYRDGKSFVYGLFHLPWRARTVWTVERAAAYWSAEIETLICTYLDPPGDERVRVLRYEDVIADPTASREITEFIGLDHHGDIGVWDKPVNTVHERYDSDRWKTFDRRSRKLMRTMNPFLERLGYEPVT
jgi:hypothetical protein